LDTDLTLFLKIDETGNPGRKTRGESHYIMAGCLITDNGGFENVTERYGSYEELKFHDFPNLRVPILKAASPYVKTVYYVQFSKKKHLWDGSNPKKLHLDMLYSFIHGVVDNLVVDRLEVVIDHNNIIDDFDARKLVHSVCTQANIRVNPLVGDSVFDYGLQTNDFFVGAIGYYFNHIEGDRKGRGYIPKHHYISYFSDKMWKLPYREYDGRIQVKSKNRRKSSTPHNAKLPDHTNVLRLSEGNSMKGLCQPTHDKISWSDYLNLCRTRGRGGAF